MEEIVRKVVARVASELSASGRLEAAGPAVGHQTKISSASVCKPAAAGGYRHGVPVGVSNRHVHLSDADLKKLFGPAYRLESYRELSQPGEFASTAFVDIQNGDRKIERLRILGPVRKKTQVELSATDGRLLKLDLPVRTSGNTAGTPGIRMTGPSGSIELTEGCIIASRHLHLTEDDAARLGVKTNQQVSVRLSGAKSAVINEVDCRISNNYKFELHIDTDDANANLVSTGDIAEIII